jgi:D-alanyl-D-alanine carboxypeptidase
MTFFHGEKEMTSLTKLISLVAAASMTVSGALNTAAPQNDVNGLLFLANRQYTVSEAYEPDDLEMSDVPGQVRRMRQEAAEALREMFQACKEEIGVQLLSISGYRSYERQEGIYKRKLRTVKGNVEKAQEYVAPPGSSEHQLGVAMDIGQKHKIHLEVSFRDTEGGKWCRENCWRFGFILRYGEEWEDITGYKFEPWHFRYVGKEYAKQIHEANIPLETWLINYRADVLRKLVARPYPVPAAATPTDLTE